MWGISISHLLGCVFLVFGSCEGASLATPTPTPITATSEVVEVSSPLHVAQCRATCLEQILKKSVPEILDCSKEPECHVCWRKCQELEMVGQWRKQRGEEDVKKSPKSVAAICSISPCNTGCGVACTFYSNHLQNPATIPVIATKSSNVLVLSPGNVSWPKQEDSEERYVYVLIQQLPHLKWSQVTQTSSNWALMPKTLWDKLEFGVRSVRVLVVSPKGLVAIYYPQLEKSSDIATGTTTTTSTTTIETDLERTWGQMMKVDETYPPVLKKSVAAASSPLVEGATLEKGEEEDDIWDLRRLSLIHQKSLVIAELAWEGVKSFPEQEYLITWELDGGGLKGHLVTDSTTVSLSLWPDTLYHIQVELFEPNFDEGEHEDESPSLSPNLGPARSKSLPLVVDTSEATFPLLVEKPSALSSQRLFSASTMVAVVVAFALVLSTLLLAISLRRLCSFQERRRFSADKQLLQDTDDIHGEDKNRNSNSNECSSLRRGSRQHSADAQAHGVSVISGSSVDVGDLKGACLPILHHLGGPFLLPLPLPPISLPHQQGTCKSNRPSSLRLHSEHLIASINNSTLRASPYSKSNST